MENSHPICCVCNKDSKFRCGKCEVKRYCSSECQNQDWKSHKKECDENKHKAQENRKISKLIVRLFNKDLLDFFDGLKYYLNKYDISTFTIYLKKEGSIFTGDICEDKRDGERFFVIYEGLELGYIVEDSVLMYKMYKKSILGSKSWSFTIDENDLTVCLKCWYDDVYFKTIIFRS